MPSEPAQPDPTPDPGELLARMRRGDRAAAAEFMTRFESRIRARIRVRLGEHMRRVFDSQDIFSTVARRLDAFVESGQLRAEDERQLWAFLTRATANAVAEKSNLLSRLRRVEGPDSEMARTLEQRLAGGDEREEWESRVAELFDALPPGQDQQILWLWLNGSDLSAIARSLDLSAAAVRKRWERIRARLREYLEGRGFQR